MAARSILITGCTRGCGRALAERFLADGHRVAGCGANPERVREACRALPGLVAEAVDVADPAAVDAWTARLAETGWFPDLLINNAALINDPAPLWDVSADAFGRIVDVNIKGMHHVVRSWVPRLLAAGRTAVIANLSSGWGRSTSPDVGPYCATKWAVEGYTRSLAQDLPEGWAAVPVNPGIIRTDMLATCFGGGADAYPSPDEWAKTAAAFFLDLGPGDSGQPVSCP